MTVDSGDFAGPSDRDADPEPAAPPVVLVRCWRCDLDMPEGSAVCPHCQARPRGVSMRDVGNRPTAVDAARPMKVLVTSFTALLVTGIVHAWVMSARFGDVEVLTDEMRTQAWIQIIVVEILDTLVVLFTYASLAKSRAIGTRSGLGPASAWLVGLAGLAVMVGINLLYHGILREIIHIPIVEDDLMQSRTWLTFAAVCIQPAIVEEAYCRGIALGLLRNVVSPQAAVWIAAVMFGLMHVSVFLSIPYLILVGAFFGYMRLASGAVWLPMVLHFLHNLAVMVYQWN